MTLRVTRLDTRRLGFGTDDAMLIVERQEKILNILRRRRTALLDDLAREMSVSSSTVRRDLDQLEQRGLVERTHGGAIYRGHEMNGSAVTAVSHGSLTQRLDEDVALKSAIGAYAAELVEPEMTLLLDGGSTVFYAAQQITARPIQVVTNSLAIANHFQDEEGVELMLIGGNLYPRTGAMVGPIASGTLADLHADLLMFSVAGIYGDAAYNINLTVAQVDQAMLRQAAQNVLLVDSHKFDRKSLTRVCQLSEIDRIVTDAGVESKWREQLGERLVVAEQAGR